MRLIFLSLLLSGASPLPAAIVYGAILDENLGLYTVSATPLTLVISIGANEILARASDAPGIYKHAAGPGGPSVFRNEDLQVVYGPVIPNTWALEIFYSVDGTLSTPGQSTARVNLRILSGAALGGGSGTILVGGTTVVNRSQSISEFTTVPISLSGSALIPISSTGVATVGFWLSGNSIGGTLDASHTLNFGGARVIDTATGLAVAGVGITSSSGFDWTQPLGGSAVPEPSTALLLLSALALAARQRWPA